jgi:hypothetical protein
MTTGFRNEWQPGDPTGIDGYGSRRKHMSRGVSFERVLEFFDHAPLRVAQAAISAGLSIVGKREQAEERSAKQQATAVRATVGKRTRRTKAQIAAAAATSASAPANGSDTQTLADA